MNLLSFLLTVLLLLLIGSFIIIGFYIITRGNKIQQPDGTFLTTGKIFRAWSLFWEQSSGWRRQYISGPELKNKYRYLLECNSQLFGKLSLSTDELSLAILSDLSASDLRYIEDLLHCRFSVDATSHLFLYTEEPRYYFPEWLRYPLSQCPPCMASVGGSLIYWPLVWQCPSLLSWSTNPSFSAIFFWVLFCMALAAGNKLLYNLAGE